MFAVVKEQKSVFTVLGKGVLSFITLASFIGEI